MGRRFLAVAAIGVFFVTAASLFAASVPVNTYKQITLPEKGNFIQNGDFEKDSDGDGMPDEWGSVEHWLPTTKATVKRVKMQDGNHALHVHFLTDGGCVINYLLREKRRYFRPAEATMLYLAVRIKHQGKGLAYAHTIDSDYRGIGSTAKTGETEGWRTVAKIFPYDPALSNGIAMVRIYVKGAAKGDQYWFDDYVLKIVSAEEASELQKRFNEAAKWRTISPEVAAKTTDVRKGNLLADSSFESNPGYCRVRDGMKWWARGGPVVKTDAKHGELAIRDLAVSDPYPFRKKIPHTVSLYAKGPKGKRLKVTVQDTFSGRAAASQAFDVTEAWKRFSFSFIPVQSAEAAQATFKVNISGPGCLIDAVQLEEGALTDYAPRPMELFLLVRRYTDRSSVAFFYDGEAIPVLAVAQEAGPAEVDAAVVVRDFWNKEVARLPVKLTVKEGAAAARLEAKVPPLARGAYRIGIEAGDAKSRAIQIGVISRELSRGSEIMGASHETGRAYNRDFIKAMGVTWTRHHSAYTGPYWGRPGDVPWLGPNYFERTDQYTEEKAWNPKLRHWGSFVYPPEPWRSKLKKIAGTDQLFPEGFYRNSEEYFKVAVPRFKKTIKYWECGNEPTCYTPKQYMDMLVWFNKTIKGLDPDAVVVGFSGFFFPGAWNDYMMPLMRMGALKHCDVISYHGYFSWWPEEKLWKTMPLIDYLKTIRKMAIQAGKPDMPIWDNEFTLWGTSWYDHERTPAQRRLGQQPFDYRTGASMIVLYVTMGYAHGVRHFGPHCFDHDLSEQSQGRMEYDQRAFEYDYGLKPKTIAYAVVCNKMQNAKLVSEKVGAKLLVYVFSKPEGSLGVVFARRGLAATASMKDPGGLVFRNIFDGPFEGVTTASGTARIKLIGEPVYVQSKMSAEKLAASLNALQVVPTR